MADAATTTSTEQPTHSSGGLPQFDTSLWPGQMVWFLIVFAVLFALMLKVFVPRVGGAIAEREDRISGDIAQARALKAQAEAQAAEAGAPVSLARIACTVSVAMSRTWPMASSRAARISASALATLSPSLASSTAWRALASAWARALASTASFCVRALAWTSSASASAAWASACAFSARAWAMSPEMRSSRAAMVPPTRGTNTLAIKANTTAKMIRNQTSWPGHQVASNWGRPPAP